MKKQCDLTKLKSRKNPYAMSQRKSHFLTRSTSAIQPGGSLVIG